MPGTRTVGGEARKRGPPAGQPDGADRGRARNSIAPRANRRIVGQGPSISPGYWNHPVEAERVFHDGWLRTGDLAREDEEGYLWIEGRQGAFLKMRGMRVSFSEAEEIAAAMPGVYECAARAVEHPEAGEALEFFIVPDPGASFGVEDVRRHLPAHWALDSIHLVSELPKMFAGKLARTSLPDPAKSLHANNG